MGNLFPATAPTVFDFDYTVDPAEIDSQQHVHNLRYLQWTLWAAHRHTEACGWDAKRALEVDQIGWVVRSHDIKYRAAAFANDPIVVRTWVSEIAPFASRRRYLVCRTADQTILCRVETRWAFVDLSVRRALPIPEGLLQRMRVPESVPGAPWEDRP